MKRSIFWFRRDLRLKDNTALNEALQSDFPVMPIFIFDRQILRELPENDARVSFIYDNLEQLHQELVKKGSSLLCLQGDPLQIWEELIHRFEIARVYINKDYEPYARKRDQKVKDLLQKQVIELLTYKDQVIFEENEVMKNDGKPYTVFTPYKNKWLEKFKKGNPEPSDLTNNGNFYPFSHPFPSLKDVGFKRSRVKVRDYDLSNLDTYASTRDVPAEDNTSYLGPHLRFGTVSPLQIITALKPSDAVFLSELIWREFFMQILFHFPDVVDHNFKTKYDGIQWRNDENEFKKWCDGQTGYPMVDAGMRQLNTTGYMHNRVRMVTAGFLCKHLLVDWRWGEAYFASKLLDYELSSNNGNWQWAAGTGCDAAPYFRIFNPIEQLKKFDKELKYVKKWIPELSTINYPAPMVDHKMARKRALEAYQKGLQSKL
ncbi:MAG: DNA photolyase family protein [Bacteroidetes bacterium]|nr:DNA photolyase family protein [Bacteroidota bacterium]